MRFRSVRGVGRGAESERETTMSTSTNPAKESLRKEQQAQREAARGKGKDAELDKALADTFPASDPVAAQSATKPGAKKRPHH